MLVSLVALLLAASSPAPAAPPGAARVAALEVRGDLAHPHAFTLAELQAMHIVETIWSVHGKEHKVRGVALDEVLAAAGFTPGATRALVIWEVDGAPLTATQGPFRLAVLTDHEPSRSIYAVHTLEVIDARDLHAVHPGTP